MIACLLMTTFAVEVVQGVLDAPQLGNVSGHLENRTIEVLWTDEPSIIGKLEKVIYDIEVYNPGQEEAVHKDSVEKRPNPEARHSWKWTSPLPLQCLPHSVRLRVSNNEDVSDWTGRKHVEGSGSNVSGIYPEEDFALAGSQKKFCCVIANGTKFRNFTHGDDPVGPGTRVKQTYIFEVTLKHSSRYGHRFSCEMEDKTKSTDAYVFVGYSPEVHNFTCETRNLTLLECSWTQGDDKNLRKGGTNYTLNGRSCKNSVRDQIHHQCSVKLSANQEEVVLILTAENKINKTTLNCTINPRHRVYLENPHSLQISRNVTSRNAHLHWSWPVVNLETLLMRCQVHYCGERACEETEETGDGLHSVMLCDLHPYTKYSVKVRCASAKHFWKWGDWSEEVSFVTREDRPQAVDVWMTVDRNKRSFVLWKELSAEQSHGKITKYELSWDGRAEVLQPAQHCVNVSTDGVGRRVTITAWNSAGSSPTSTITIPTPPADVKKSPVKGSNGSLELSWDPEPGASCGYVVDWLAVGSQDKCGIEWIKIPAGHNSARINSGFKDGVRYTLSLYACSPGAPKLLQRWEGYGREQAPNKAPGVHAVQDGHDVLLSWDEIPLEDQRGFIQGYVINYSLSSHENMGQHKTKNIRGSKRRMQEKITGLVADEYVFWISAYTSGGEGPANRTSITLPSQTHQIIVNSIISLGFAILLAVMLAIVWYRKRTWLKETLYPPIPAPWLDCSTSNGILDFELLEVPTENVEHPTTCELKLDAEEEIVSALPFACDDGATGFDNTLYLLTNGTNNDVDSSGSQPFLLPDNLIYKNIPVPNCDKPSTTAASTGSYNSQCPPVHTEMLPCSDTYEPLQGICKASQSGPKWRSDLEDDACLDLVCSPIAVNSSQPLLRDSFGSMEDTPS
ncbi:hypothetical protein ACEWY4_004427 [Coilia grayii]|uniref:Fibronectin type-III domain-containing protein n=1 Tax=Coilia grayii TaxID=363190 RepID=A0ABD1KLL1_9TELE